MYESFFNLTIKPFDLLPNPDFLYLSRSHKRALMYLNYGIQERAGFMLLTGGIGSGKTTIIRDIVKRKESKVVLSKIFNTKVNFKQLLAMINEDFGLISQGKDKVTLLRELNDFLISQFAHGNQPVLIIDEAQNLSTDVLEEVRMLSNLETDRAKLLQIILVGQPELRETLASPALVQLRQRIKIKCHIPPLSPAETKPYILHRLEMAGNRNAVIFPQEVLETIFRYSGGTPRLINVICDFILLAAYAEETRQIDGEMVREIIGDLDFENRSMGCGNNEESSTVAGTGTEGMEQDACESRIMEQLNNVIRRLETLENRDVPSCPPGQKGAELHEVRKDIRFRDAIGTPLSSPPSREEERKKGFLGNLFRAV
jgi:general secretion pathway protein A